MDRTYKIARDTWNAKTPAFVRIPIMGAVKTGTWGNDYHERIDIWLHGDGRVILACQRGHCGSDYCHMEFASRAHFDAYRSDSYKDREDVNNRALPRPEWKEVEA